MKSSIPDFPSGVPFATPIRFRSCRSFFSLWKWLTATRHSTGVTCRWNFYKFSRGLYTPSFSSFLPLFSLSFSSSFLLLLLLFSFHSIYRLFPPFNAVNSRTVERTTNNSVFLKSVPDQSAFPLRVSFPTISMSGGNREFAKESFSLLKNPRSKPCYAKLGNNANTGNLFRIFLTIFNVFILNERYSGCKRVD